MISVKNYVVFDQKIYIIGVIPISEHRVPVYRSWRKLRPNVFGRKIYNVWETKIQLTDAKLSWLNLEVGCPTQLKFNRKYKIKRKNWTPNRVVPVHMNEMLWLNALMIAPQVILRFF